MHTLLLVSLALVALAATADAQSATQSPASPALQDCPVCPRMVSIPAGSFTMGSPASEPERHKSEGPQRAVSIEAFAASRSEVTRGQYAAFLGETKRQMPLGCDTHGDGVDTTSDHDPAASWRDPGFAQTDDHPVVCVTWQDARDYAAWLARKTGRSYRLLSNAEWEYAARAGTTSVYFWGDDADRGCAFMNGGDQSLARALPPWTEAVRRDREAGFSGARLVGCDDGSAFTSAVGRYEPNAFGLNDVTGNVWEWVADCPDSPDTAPPSAQASANELCPARNVRGGSWDDWPMDLRSADRHKTPPDTRRNDLGFRVARDEKAH